MFTLYYIPQQALLEASQPDYSRVPAAAVEEYVTPIEEDYIGKPVKEISKSLVVVVVEEEDTFILERPQVPIEEPFGEEFGLEPTMETKMPGSSLHHSNSKRTST